MKHTFKKGINLGGWLSQYEKWDSIHFQSFITRQDLKQIKEWKFDHVRLPIDCTLFMMENGEIINKGIYFVDKAIEKAINVGLSIVLDLHRAPGYHLGDMVGNDLFINEEKQKQYLQIWQDLTQRYICYKEEIRFELLNEACDSNPYRPNILALRTVEKIREVDKDRILIIGGDNYNHIDSLSRIWVINDNKIVYNFHYYDPNPFTNQGYQRVHKFPEPRYDAELSYPGEFPDYGEYLKIRPELAEEYGKFAFIRNDKLFMEKNINKAVDFIKYNKRQVYCGEFGVVFYAKGKERVKWVRDLVSLLNNADIGWAYWTYKGMDYGLVSETGDVFHPELIETLINA